MQLNRRSFSKKLIREIYNPWAIGSLIVNSVVSL